MQRNIQILVVMFAVACLPANLQAQDNDRISLRLTYLARYTAFVEHPRLHTDTMRLDVGQRFSSFYSLPQLRSQQFMDKVNREGRDIEYVKRNAPTTFGQAYSVFKKQPECDSITFFDKFIVHTFKVVEHMKTAWNLLDGDSTICGYACKKAQTEIRGRTWVAWYAMEIPIADGPWKLHGLPGAILYAHSTDGRFYFDCIGIAASPSETIAWPSGHITQCALKTYLNAYYRFKENPMDALPNIKVMPGVELPKATVQDKAISIEECR